MKIALFIKKEIIDSIDEDELIKKINSFGFVYEKENPDVVFTIGGDGTFLKAVQKYLSNLSKVKFLCFNKGKLGYFSDFKIEDFDEVLSLLKNNEIEFNSFNLLTSKIDGEDLYAVNEIRIENPFHTLTCDVFINSALLETFRGNGLVVSTSLGSSAYNRSLGGALVDTKISSLQLSEIAPINNCLFSSLKSPLVLSSEYQVTFKGELDGVVIGYDYLIKSTKKLNELTISLSDKKVTIASKKDSNYISKLNKTFVERR